MARSVRTILAQVAENHFEEEGTLTAAAVYPGMLLERTSTADTFQAHSTEGGPAECLVALEDDGKGGDVTDAYAASGRVRMIRARKGDKIYVRVKDTSSSGRGTISRGEFLESNGDGYARAWSAATGAVDSASDLQSEFHPLFVADEAIDMADSSGVTYGGFLKVVVL